MYQELIESYKYSRAYFEIVDFLDKDEIAKNTPHAEQFKEKNLGKKKKRSL